MNPEPWKETWTKHNDVVIETIAIPRDTPAEERVSADLSNDPRCLEAELQAELDASDALLFDIPASSDVSVSSEPIADYDDSEFAIKAAKQAYLEQEEKLREKVLSRKKPDVEKLTKGTFFDPIKIWNEKEKCRNLQEKEGKKPPITNRGVPPTLRTTNENLTENKFFLSSSHNQGAISNDGLIDSKILESLPSDPLESLTGSTKPLALDSYPSSLNDPKEQDTCNDLKLSDPSKKEGLEVCCHWLEGVTYASRYQVLDGLSRLLDLPLGFDGWEAFPYSDHNGYTKMFKYGDDFKVSYDPDRKEQGVFIAITGKGCEQVGDLALAKVYYEFFAGEHSVFFPDHVTRIDLAVDYCRFTVEQIRSEWKKDNVRTKVQYSKKAMEGRESFRNGKFQESSEGDTFDMGSKKSLQHGCCYNRRGFTRFELRSRGHLAQGRAASYFATIAGVDVLTGEVLEKSPLRLVIGFIREFVDFVDVENATEREDYNRGLCKLLPFWQEFVVSCERVKVPSKEKTESSIVSTSVYVENNSCNFYLYIMDKYHSAMEKQESLPSLLRLCQEYLKRGLVNCKSKHRLMLRSMGFDPDDPALDPMGFL